MRRVRLETLVPQANARTVFDRISDFPRYADHTDAVREIHIDHRSDGVVTSTWSVNFRNGVLCWSERDHIDADRLHMAFEQLDGDFDRFAGTWQLAQTGDDTTVVFTAEFDLGMPSLAALIDPIAERALLDNMAAILRGLLGEQIVFRTESAESAATGVR